MMSGRRPRWRRVVLALGIGLPLLGYGSACAWLYTQQRSLLYWPPAVERAELDRRAKELGARAVELEASDGVQLYAWHRPAQGERAVLFFHGSGETVFRTDLPEHLLERGWDVLVPSYRGYPGSEGAPSEEGFRLDARAAWTYLTESLHIPPERIVIHGMSLGGGVATQLAAEVQPGALVLESTFLSVPAAAAELYPAFPVRWLVRDRFDSGAAAGSVEVPVLVVHSIGDEVIPIAHARALAASFPSSQMVEVRKRIHGATLTVEEPVARDAYDALLERVRRAAARVHDI